MSTTTLPKFSQSVGPGIRPSSPQFKPRAGHLPRPESPLRKGPVLAPPGRSSLGVSSLSKSQIGTSRYTSSPVPKPLASKTPQPARTARTSSRAASRLSTNGHDVTPTAPARSSDGSGVGSASSASGFTPVARRSLDDAQEEINRLKKQLESRDFQLKEQASSLAEMESSLTELQNMMPETASLHGRNRSGVSTEDNDSPGLRAVIR
jgi:hypothetical protein